MVIEYRICVGDPEVEINREGVEIRLIYDPRLTILQIRRSLIEILKPDELTDFINTTAIVIDYRAESSLLSLVS